MSRPAKRGLGRGLGALLRTGDGPSGIVEVGVDQVVENPHQPRSGSDPASTEELSESIREHGVLQPLLVTQVGLDDQGRPRYQLIAGERRWRAARKAGLAQVPVMVKEVTPVEILSLALVENIQREDLNALEAAVAYRQLIDEFGLTQAEVARQVGKSRSTVANTVRLANLPSPVKDALMSRKIDEGHARALLGLPDEDTQVRALARVLAGGLSVRETESLVRAWLAESSDRESQVEQNPEDGATEDMLRTSLGTKVSLIRRGDRGRLVIHFYSRDQLSAVVDLLTTESSPSGEEYFEAG